MKKVKIIAFLIILTSSLSFVQCTTEPIPGPPGQAGINGIDGTDGVDGVDGTASCTACHSENHREPIISSYLYSGHAAGGAVGYAGSRANCAQCHSNEGYTDYLETGAANPEGYESPTRIDCNTCHNKHTTFDFENDGHDYALRNMNGVDLTIGIGIIDYEGTSNNCLTCHQPRRTPPTDDGNGMFNITPHYGPHYGAQSTMLEGVQGALIAGSVGYPGVGSSTHRQGASCVSCHMGTPNDNDGEHTMVPSLKSCTTCHPGATNYDINGVQTEVTALMSELEGLLKTEGILDDDGGLVTGEFPIGSANAYWNWEFVYQDHSHGVHNPAYTKALLKNSIEALKIN